VCLALAFALALELALALVLCGANAETSFDEPNSRAVNALNLQFRIDEAILIS
jgi:hypothetical protein